MRESGNTASDLAKYSKRYIKTGVIPGDISDIIGDAFEIRNYSDYDDMFIASKSRTEEQVKNARTVIDTVKRFLVKEGVTDE